MLEFFNIKAQNPSTKRMKRADPQVLDGVFVDLRFQPHLLVWPQHIECLTEARSRFLLHKQGFDPLLHFSGGFVGEGDSQNLVGIDAMVLNQMGNPEGEGARFARPGPSND
jgi:hypothetical protein